MAVSPPFTIAETSPADNDLISIFPSQEQPFRDTVESWLTFLSDPTTGLLKASAFAFPLVITNSAAGTFFELESTNTDANEGPSLSIYRNSASPLAGDIMGVIRWNGEDSAGNKQEYGHIRVDIADPTSTSEDGTMLFVVTVAGSTTVRATLNAAGVTLAGTLTYAGAIAGLTGTGALDSGSITSGFGSINVGADAITGGAITGTTGTFSGAVSMAGLTATTGTFSSDVSAAGAFISTTRNFAAATAGTMVFRPNGAASSSNQMTYTSAGTLTAAGDITAFSDRRMKKSISRLNHLWANDMVREVHPVTFIRKRNDQRGIGFIAQDVRDYAPEIVHEDARGYLSLAYPNMVAILWAVVQDLQVKVAELEAK